MVERRIHATVQGMEGMINGFDFATVVHTYWRGYQLNDEAMKNAALRWLRGEYNSKTDARAELWVRVIINDGTWYDYLKLMANFMHDIGYKGLVLFLDEAVNLYKISNRVARENYERLLTIFNDILQGKSGTWQIEFRGHAANGKRMSTAGRLATKRSAPVWNRAGLPRMALKISWPIDSSRPIDTDRDLRTSAKITRVACCALRL